MTAPFVQRRSEKERFAVPQNWLKAKVIIESSDGRAVQRLELIPISLLNDPEAERQLRLTVNEALAEAKSQLLS